MGRGEKNAPTHLLGFLSAAWRSACPPAWEPRPGVWTSSPSSPQISVPGNLGTAILPGLGRRSEYEITILAYYRDGARSDPVSLHYTPST